MPINQRNKEREVRTIPARELRVAKADDGSRTVEGYAIVYNSASVDLGGFREIVAPGALTRSLKESPDVLCLRDHDSSLLLGRTTSGTLTLTEDQTGLRFACRLPNTTAANDLAESIDRGDIDACSFGFVTVNDTWSQDALNNAVRTLLDVELFEVSVVSFPAYASTSAALRTAPKEIRSMINAAKRADDACSCDCPECLDGNCDDCSDDDCDDPLCNCADRDDADMDTDSVRAVRSWRELGELRLKLHTLTN